MEQARRRLPSIVCVMCNSKAGPVPDPLLPLESAGMSVPAEDEHIEKQQWGSLICEIYVPHELPAGNIEATLTLTCDKGELKIPVTLTVWDFTLPDHLSFLPEMNCYGLPENERDYYRLAHRHRTVLNRVPVLPERHAWTTGARRVGRHRRSSTGGLGPAVRAALRRLGVRRPAAQGRADRMLLPAACTRTGPRRWRGTTTASYWADRAFPPSVSPGLRRGLAAVRRALRRARAGTTRSSSASSTARTTSRARLVARVVPLAAGRAGQLPGLLGAALLRRGVPRRDRRTPGGNAEAGLPLRHLPAAVAARRARRLARLQRGRRGDAFRVSPAGLRPQGEPGPDRGRIRHHEPDRGHPTCSRSAGAWTPGRSAATACSPGRPSAAATPGKNSDTCLFYPGQAIGLKGPVPSIRLKAYLRGQQDVEYLVLLAKREKQSQLILGQRQFRTRCRSTRSATAPDSSPTKTPASCSSPTSPATTVWPSAMRIAASILSGK